MTGVQTCALPIFNVAKECLLAALKADPKAAHIWANLATAYYMTRDHRSSGKCLERVLMAHCQSHYYVIFGIVYGLLVLNGKVFIFVV